MESNNLKKRLGDYFMTDHFLGRGAYGCVYLGYHKSKPEELLAFKQFEFEKKSSAEMREKTEEIIKKELNALKALNHENMIKFVTTVTTVDNFYIITEFCEGGDLLKKIEKKSVSKTDALRYFKQIVEAMNYANSKEYFHRDIKPENILLKNNNIKLADFGFAKRKEDLAVKSDQTYCGSPLYMAPEVAGMQNYSFKCDVWSVGVILYQLLVGQNPWPGKSQHELAKNIKEKDLEFPKECDLEPEIIDLLKKMLEKDQDKRITFQEIIPLDIMKKIKEKNPIADYFNYLTNMANFLVSLGKEIRKKLSKLGFEKEFSLKLQAILLKVALNNENQIVAIMEERQTPKEDQIKKQHLTKENIKKLTQDYIGYFEKLKAKFDTFVKENGTLFDKDFKENVLNEDPNLSKEFKKIYRKTFEAAIEYLQKRSENILSTETEIEILRLILKIIKIRKYTKLFEEFCFDLDEENEKMFDDFKEELEKTGQNKLIKILKKMMMKLLKDQDSKKLKGN